MSFDIKFTRLGFKNTHVELLGKPSDSTSVLKALPGKLDIKKNLPTILPGRVAQSVTCLATDACLTADPGVAGSIPPGTILSWKLIMK